jgi:exoribonuclease R
MITGIGARGLNIILPEFGIEGLIEHKLDNLEEKALEVEIDGRKLKLFDRVKVKVEVTLKHFKK